MFKKKEHQIIRIIFLVYTSLTGIASIILMFNSREESFLGIALLMAFFSSMIMANQHEILYIIKTI